MATPDQFTSQLRQNYLKAQLDLYASASPPWESFTTTLPSDSRIENYIFASAPSFMRPYLGFREFDKLDSFSYPVPNSDFHDGFSVLKNDVDDDKIGLYALNSEMIVRNAQNFKGFQLYKTLKGGETANGIDGTPYFGATHAAGTSAAGGNVLNYTAASADGATYRMIFLCKDATAGIKPLLLQVRQEATSLQTDAGEISAQKNKKYDYWVDARYGFAFGWWWDALLVKITNTPSATEVQDIFAKATVRLRSFRLPTGSPSDPQRGVHEGLVFGTAGVTVLASTGLEPLLRTVLNSEVIVQAGAPVSNIYRGYADLISTAQLDY